MAYDPDPAATHNPATGVVVPVSWLDLINSNFAELGAAWTSYTPTWSGTIGNGTLAAAYLKIGRTVHYRIKVVWGTTTSHAAANQTFTLPAAPHSAYVANTALGNGSVLDSGTASYAVTALMSSGSTVLLIRNDTGATVTNTSPVTFATADHVLFSGTYESAA